MVTLVINPGSSSKKYALYKDGKLLLSIKYEKTGDGFGRCTQVSADRQHYDPVNVHMYREALHEVLGILKKHKCITSLADIDRVAIRIVAPGRFFQAHRLIDEHYIGKLVRLESILPLHIPPVLEEITSVNKLLPTVTSVGVSDSAFHTTVPEPMAAYSLRDAAGLEIRRYGYHGISVASIIHDLPEKLLAEHSRIVVAHIGSGTSVTALKNQKSVYNSMGYTPASGVMMGSRAGDIDPGALIEILQQTETKLSGGHRYIQSNGGFAGLLGVSDIRSVLTREQQGDIRAKEALEMFLFEVKAQIAKAVVVLGGIDLLVLSATAMERNSDLRARLLEGLEFLGIKTNKKINEVLVNRYGEVSDADSQVLVVLVPTNEQAEMARIAASV